jgi:predicted permease
MSFESLRHDVRMAVRSLLREPGHSAVALLILAVGIGANTAVFSVVNPLVLKPLPFHDADRLVWIANNGRGTGLSGKTVRVAAYEAMARENRSFESMSAYFAFFGYISNTLTGRGDAERLAGVQVAPGFLDVLGVRPVLGRDFTREQWQVNGPDAVLLTSGLWQRRFGADPAIVGTTVSINDTPHLVAGILPGDFDFGGTFTPGTRVDMLMPARLEQMRPWGNTLAVIGRLKPGISIEQARAEFQTLVPQIIATLDGYQFGADMTTLKAQVSGSMRRSLLVLWAAVGFVLLIVCANLSNLLLARTSGRAKEFAVRMALGSSRARLISQLLIEGVLLAIAGAAIGIPLAYALTSLLTASANLSVPLLHQVRVDGVTLMVTGLTAVVSGLAFGALPAIRVAMRPPQDALRAQGRGVTDNRQQTRLRSALVVGEVALATVLLVGAGLLLRSFVQLLEVDLGFDAPRAIAIRVETSAELSPEARQTRLFAVARQVREVAGVEAAGLTDALPLDRNRTWNVRVPGRVYRDGQAPGAFVYVTGTGYFGAMGIRLVGGRDFTDHDGPDRGRVGIVNETLAALLYPGQDAVGQTAQTGDNTFTIVGVVADVRQSSLDETPAAQMYFPYSQSGGGPSSSDLIVRSALPPTALVASVRSVIQQADASVRVTEARPISHLVDRAVSPRKFLVALLVGFAGVGLLLACLGIYGVISYGVAQREPEIGLRMALGATPAVVRRQVLGETLRLAVGGLALGLVASVGLARVIGALLYDTSPRDPLTFMAAAGLLAAVAMAAGLVPAVRASRVDPLTAIRAD